ncbi:thioesterase family protein [Clostridium sp. KNHs214]|uniref:acyl-CoA thioesterase n=1 Tax=Clostridium sp. KNHs214 TaxID=1540257 RepID=UPI0005533288|nr:thioesterase family protein [Clostridium sp. KNHs214]
MYINETNIEVRYVETDKMGIVHHSNYYAWFEVGRGAFIKGADMTYRDMENYGVMLPVLESGCKYIEGAKYEDELIIQTWIEEMNGAKLVFNYNVIRKEDSKIIAKGSTKHAFVNSDFRIINIKKKMPELWNKLEKLYVK